MKFVKVAEYAQVAESSHQAKSSQNFIELMDTEVSPVPKKPVQKGPVK